MRRPREYQTLMPPPRRPPRLGQGALGFGGLVGVDELVAALLDAGEVGVGVDVVDAVVEEGGPVVGDDLVEVGDELVAVVGTMSGPVLPPLPRKMWRKSVRDFLLSVSLRMRVSASSQRSSPSW
jgi:hypothetical protein